MTSYPIKGTTRADEPVSNLTNSTIKLLVKKIIELFPDAQCNTNISLEIIWKHSIRGIRNNCEASPNDKDYFIVLFPHSVRSIICRDRVVQIAAVDTGAQKINSYDETCRK